jgi:hypothetical protein
MGQRRNLKCDAPSGLATDCGRMTGYPKATSWAVNGFLDNAMTRPADRALATTEKPRTHPRGG